MTGDENLPELLDAVETDTDAYDDGQVKPWERLNGETVRQYAAFCIYRDLGPERTIRKAADHVGGNPDSWRQLSSQHGWVHRAQAYDDWLERAERKLIERGRLEARRRQINIGQMMQEKAIEGLTAMNPYTATPRDLALIADIGSKLVKSGQGEIETKRLEITGAGGGPIGVANELSAADRRELLAALVAEADRRVAQLTGQVENIIEGEIVEDDDVQE